MILPADVLREVNDFFEDLTKFNINHEFRELNFSRGNRNYERILKRLEGLNLPDPSLLIFQSLTLKEIKELLIQIMCKIFGSNYKEKIQFLNRMIRLENINDPFEATIEEKFEGDILHPVNVFISNQCKSIQVVSTGHEYVHCFQSPYVTTLYNRKINNIHYKELLSIIVEYIVCYELSIMLKDDTLLAKHDLIRINHDFNQAQERKASLAIEPKLNKLNPIDRDQLKSYIEYQKHNSFGYIISDIYATHLFDEYLDKPETLIQIIKEIIESDKCIMDLITYYNLSLTNQEVIGKYNAKIDEVSKRKVL